MTLPTWEFKRGDDWTAPQAIHVQIDGEDVDLSDPDWTVAAQARRQPDSSVAVDFDIDADLLADSKVLLSLERAVTEDMDCRIFDVDLQVTNDDLGIGRRSSATWTIRVVADITREEVGS